MYTEQNVGLVWQARVLSLEASLWPESTWDSAARKAGVCSVTASGNASAPPEGQQEERPVEAWTTLLHKEIPDKRSLASSP